MKLWQKIFVCTLLLMTAAIDLTALVLVRGSHELMLSRERTRCAADQETLALSLANQVVYQRLVQNRVLLTAAAVEELIGEGLQTNVSAEWGAAMYATEGDTFIAAANAEPITQYAARNALLADDAYSQTTVESGGRHYLLTGSTLLLEGRQYALFTASDISAIYEQETQQLHFVRRMSLIFAVGSALLLLLLVWRLLRPLQRLGTVARTIAAGDYTARAPTGGGTELRELATDMNGMAAAVEENVHRLTQVAEERRLFIANLSHEMKTPLTSILGFADILRISRNVSEEQRREYAGIIAEEAGRLKTLSGKLMELLTVGSTELSHDRIHLPELCGEVAAALRPALTAQNIALHVEASEGDFDGDVALLKSLLYNLMDNAVKASARGGDVMLCGRCDEKKVHFTVTDHGIGMSPETVARATQPFYMADKSRSRRAGGAGLGLALCDGIVKAHGGTLHIDSTPNVGTTVTVTLPRQEEET